MQNQYSSCQQQNNFIERQIICSDNQCRTRLSYKLGVYCVKCPICNAVTAAQNLNVTSCNKCNNKLY